MEQGRVKHWCGIENLDDVFRRDLRLAIMQFNNDSGKPLFAEGNEYASADHRNVSVYAIGENDVERYGNRYVAELRLSRHAENMLQVGEPRIKNPHSPGENEWGTQKRTFYQ